MPLPSDFGTWPADMQRAHLKQLTKNQLLDALYDECLRLNAIVDDIPNLILDGLEKDLSTDLKSKQAASSLLDRIQRESRKES